MMKSIWPPVANLNVTRRESSSDKEAHTSSTSLRNVSNLSLNLGILTHSFNWELALDK